MRLIVKGPLEIPKSRRPSPALLTLKTKSVITPHPSIASALVTKAAWVPHSALPGSSSCHHFTVRLRKIQKHPGNVTGDFWPVTFWQMLLLAMNYSSCLSFLTTQPLCLLSESASGAMLSNFRKPQASFTGERSPSRVQAWNQEARLQEASCSRWRDRCPAPGDEGEETRRDGRGDTPTLTTGPRGRSCLLDSNGTVLFGR